MTIFINMEIKEVTTLVLDSIGNLLTEGRVEDVKNKYPNYEFDNIDTLISIDPSTNNKYLSWLAKIWLPRTIKWYKDNPQQNSWRDERNYSPEDVPTQSNDELWGEYKFRTNRHTLNNDSMKEWSDALEHFHKNPSKYESKDINQYNHNDFIDAVEKAKQKLSRKEMKETGIDKVFEDDEFILLMPKTHKAACRYGSRTRWCVVMRGYTGYFERYFTEGPIFFLIDKRRLEPTKSMATEDYYKIAMHYRPFNARLQGGGKRGLTLAQTKTKEEFIDGANLANTRIDYWNVQDQPKKENVVLKFLGGPGRGQTQRGTETLGKLKSVMETYTKKVLEGYYDSLEMDPALSEKIVSLEQKISDLDSDIYNWDGKVDELSGVRRNLSDYLDYFNEPEFRSEKEQGLYDWGETQMNKAEEYEQTCEVSRGQARDKRSEAQNELQSLKDAENKKGLFFYDIEKSVPIT